MYKSNFRIVPVRCFINYQRDYWVDYLTFEKFGYNDSIHFSTKFIPLLAHTGIHPPCTMLEHLEISKNHFAEDLPTSSLGNLQNSHHLRNSQATPKKFSDRLHLDSSS